jgi:hypothetical protein
MDRIFSKPSLVDQLNLADGSWFCRQRVPTFGAAVLKPVFGAIKARLPQSDAMTIEIFYANRLTLIECTM